MELVHQPPEYSTLATFHMSLEQLLHGDDQIEQTFSQHLTGEPGEEDSDNITSSNKKVVTCFINY